MNKAKTKSSSASPSETISKLQRGVLRLALSFHGQHPELDKRLKRLGTLIRGGRKDTELQQLIDEIVDTIVSQNVTQNSDQRGGRSVTDLIEKICVQAPDIPALKSIQAKLANPLDSSAFDRALESAAQVIAEATATPSKVEQPAATGVGSTNNELITRLIDGIDNESEPDSELAALLQRVRRNRGGLAALKQIDELSAFISSAFKAAGDDEHFRQARDQLMLLMNLIPFGSDLTPRANNTRRSIEQSSSAAELYGCIPEIAELTSAMRQQLQTEIAELAEFLKVTLSRLHEFEVQLNHSNTTHESSRKNAFNLEETIESEVRKIRDDIADEMDIDIIKASVTEHLDKIGDGLTNYVRSEDQRHQQARDKLDSMVSALNELESEAEELRDTLERQHEQVLIDPLTGILNRSGYDENITKEFNRWKRYRSSLSLAVIDLDLFKHINDSYGHTAGDKVLSTVAKQIESQIRDSDILCRYGGEEFVLLLPETNLDQGSMLLDKLRKYISQCNFHYQHTPVPVTLSCGVAEFHDGDDIVDVFERADQAMYLAKRSGRNQTRSESELDPTET